MQAKAMACPDKRLHPHLCNCKNPRVMVATPKTHSFQRVRAKKKILLDKHLRGETDMYERVKAAKMKYTPPIPSKRRPHFVKSPHYELNIPIQDHLEEAAVQIQRVLRGCAGRNMFRREYFFHSVRRLAQYFDNWKAAITYNQNIRRLQALRFLQRNIRAIWLWRANRHSFLSQARKMTSLLQVLERLLAYKVLHKWKDEVVFKLHRRKFALTFFHLRRHTALCKFFRTMHLRLFRVGFRTVFWKNVLRCRIRENVARCTIVMSRWKRFCNSKCQLRRRRKTVTFKAWAFYWRNSKLASQRRYRIWAAGILQREVRAYLTYRDYIIKMASIRLINRFWRGTLGRDHAYNTWLRRHNIASLRLHFSSWIPVTVLWKKERVYRENVAARLEERGVHDKMEDWSNVEEALEKSWSGSSFRGVFPLPEPAAPFPTKGRHVKDQFVPPAEWGNVQVHQTVKRSSAWRKTARHAGGSAFLFLRSMVQGVAQKYKHRGVGVEVGVEVEVEVGVEEEEKQQQQQQQQKVPRTLTLVKAKQATAQAARFGYLRVLQWLRQNKCAWDEEVMSEAALGGHLDVLMWSHDNGCPVDEQTTENAAMNGSIEMLKYCLEAGFPRNMRVMTRMAARGQQLSALKWMCATQTGFALHPLCVVSAIYGATDVNEKDDEPPELVNIIEFLFEHAESVNLLTEETCAAAAKRGRLQCLQWLRRFGAPWDWRVLTACREMKRKKVLQWVKTHGGDRIRLPGDKAYGNQNTGLLSLIF